MVSTHDDFYNVPQHFTHGLRFVFVAGPQQNCERHAPEVDASVQALAIPAFVAALLLMGTSLACLMVEVWITGGALRILLKALEDRGS